jgi:hypothetical protein
LGRVLIVAGLALVAAGLLLTFARPLPFRLGRLPGDFLIQGKRSTIYFPLTTCVLVSLALSLALWILRK